MAGIFDETTMREALERYIPDGETLVAGIHAVAKETSVKYIFGKCICGEDRLIPDEQGGSVSVNKKKYSTYDIYFGITQSSMVITECESSRYYYEIENVQGVKEADVQEVTSEILFTDMGKCFPLTDVQNCELKKGWMGSVKCFLTMKNGDYFKLMFPKLGGLGGDMPHHTEYREAIIARLGGGSI